MRPGTELRFKLSEISIPIELYINPHLTFIDMCVFCIIRALDREFHCIASNDYIATILNVSESKVSKSISCLIEQQYLHKINFNGRIRELQVNSDYVNIYRVMVDDFHKRDSDYYNRATETSKDVLGCIAHPDDKYYINNKEKINKQFATQTDGEPSVPFSRDNFKEDKRIRDPEVKKEIHLTNASKDIIETVWKSFPLSKHREGTNVYTSSAVIINEMMKGTFFNTASNFVKYKGRKFTKEDFQLSISRLAKAATQPEYEPKPGTYKEYLRKISLENFLYNPKGKTPKTESLFLYYLENEPDRVDARFLAGVDADKPAVRYIVERYKKIVGLNGQSLSNAEMRDINHAVQKIKERLPEYRAKIKRFDYNKTVNEFEDDESVVAKYIMDALEDCSKSMDITSGWICSDRTFNDRLPNHLKKVNALGTGGEGFNILDRKTWGGGDIGG